MSIFTKFCPQCSDSVESSAARCHCGYIFDTTTDGSICAGDLLEQNERMYLEYLEARVIQAEQECEVARNASARDPGNRLATAELLRAEQAMNNARAELSSQALRLETTRAVVTRARPVAAPQPIVAPPPPKSPTADPGDSTLAQETLRALKAAQSAKPARVSTPKKATPAEPQPLPGLKLPVPRKPAATMTTPARRTVSASKPAARADTAETFRATQAAKAEGVMRKNTARPRAVPVPPKAAPAKPRSVDPLASAKAAMQVRHAPPPNTRECPNCTATLALEIARCRCGYEFPTQGAEIPALSLPAADLAALSASLSLSPLNRGG